MGKNWGVNKYYYRAICAFILTVIATVIFFYVWKEFVAQNNQTNALTGYGNLGMAFIIYFQLYGFISHKLHGFKIGVERKANIIASNIIALLLANVLEILISMAITGQFRFFWMFFVRYLLMFIIQSLIIGIVIIPMINIYRRKFSPLQIIEIYGNYTNDVYRKVDALKYKYHIIDQMHYTDPRVDEGILKYDAVLINDVPADEKNRILKKCFDADKRAYFVPKISDIIVRSAEELNLIDTPLYLCRNNGITMLERIAKRIFDFMFSFIALVVLSPVLGITALAIKLNDGGPVFFKQERVTKGNKKFIIIKFRSMIVDAEKDGKPHPAGEADDRITKVGKIIRTYRIDELPQLFNILKGEMSIVGPRPERVEHVKKYTADIAEFACRNKMKGGLTGYAQVYGKYNTSALDKLKLDLEYIMNYSLLMDFQIILETIKILFQKESTEGFDERRITEMHDTGSQM